MIETAVHLATPAHTAAFDIGDLGGAHTNRDAAVPILLNNLITREMRRGVERKMRAFLHEEYVETGFGKKGSRDGAARTSADDHDLRPHLIRLCYPVLRSETSGRRSSVCCHQGTAQNT